MSKYNITEKKNKVQANPVLMRAVVKDELEKGIYQCIVVEKKYKEPGYNLKRLALDLGTNTRYISAVCSERFHTNYCSLVNAERIREAKVLLTTEDYADCTAEEIGELVGFNNRQSFYGAFFRHEKTTPAQYRKDNRPAQTSKKV
ncbi:helix-turn-helix domain-containing protein [Segatella oulorum]|mgnify:FL=1|uniref:helix-turn-helix domain-containing protein n=1 Tax=Segatella oulorum TaxID=28136 RepID=UPI0023F0CD8F|nr:AraC family transcriptional regulator [Segatella oulorum]